MRSIPPLVAALLLAATASTSAPAQQPAPTLLPEPPLAVPILGSLGLGAVGFAGGAIVGWKVGSGWDTNCSDEWCGISGAAVGALIGETVGVSLGAHLGNRRRGSFGLDFLTATGAGAVAIVLTAASGNGGGAVLVLGTIAQVGTTVAVERSLGRSRARRVPAVSLVPMRDHRIALSATIPLP